MNRLLLTFFLSVILLLTACVPQGSVTTPTPIPTPVVPQKPTYTVQRGTVSRVLELRGRVSAVKQEDLFFRANGTVDDVFVSRGDTVTEGQVLAQLSERETFEAAVSDAKLDEVKAQQALDALSQDWELDRAKAHIALLKAQTDLQKARNDRLLLDRPRASAITIAEAEAHFALMDEFLNEARKLYEGLEKRPVTDPERMAAIQNLNAAQRTRDQALANVNWYKGHSTEAQILDADAKVALAEAELHEAQRKFERIKDGPDPYDIALAEATLARAEGALKKAEASLDALVVIAPFDGMILSMTLTPGLQAAAFKTVLTLVDPEGLEITLNPSPSDMMDISVGQTAIVRLPNRPGQEYDAIVRYIPLSGGSSSPGQSTDQGVRVSFEDSATLLTMGEVATVIIELEERPDVLWLSPAALRTFQGRDFVIIQDGDLQRRVDIRLGLRSQERVEIVEGLTEGQIVLGP